jgi:SAM-dependent methyltransferase
MNYFYRIFSKIYERAAKKMCCDCQGFIKEGVKILDLGSGSGIIGNNFQKYFKGELIGVDIKDQRIVNIPFQIYNGVSLPFQDNYFDVVLINYVLHHCQDPPAILKEAKRVVKDRIIIYEDLAEGILAKLICKIHGISFSFLFQKNEEKGNFKKINEWKKVFDNLGLKLIFEKKVSSIFNPVKKKLFVLEKV